MRKVWFAATLALGAVLLTSVQASAQGTITGPSKQATLAAPFPGDEYEGDLDGQCPVYCEEGDMSITLAVGFSGTLTWSFNIVAEKKIGANSYAGVDWKSDKTRHDRTSASGSGSFNVMPGDEPKVITPAYNIPAGTPPKLSGIAGYQAPRGSASYTGRVTATTTITVSGTTSKSETPYSITIKPHL